MRRSPADLKLRRWTWGSREKKQLKCEGRVLHGHVGKPRQGKNHPEGGEGTKLRTHTRLKRAPGSETRRTTE